MPSKEKTKKDTCSVVAFAPDGLVIASGYASGIIRLWQAETKKELLVLTGHKDRVNSLTFSPDGQFLASGSSDRRIIIWDPYKGELLKTLRGHGGAINSLAFDPTGTLLASGSSDKRIRIWNRKRDWKKKKELKGHEDSIAEIKFSPINKLLASASWDHTVGLWSIEDGEKIAELKGHFGPIYGLDFHPEGTKLITCSSDGVLKLWDVDKKTELKQLAAIPAAFWAVAFHPNGKVVASGSTDHLVRLWDITTMKEIKELKAHKELVTDVVFSPDGDILLSSSVDGIVQIWDASKILQKPKPGLFSRAKDLVLRTGVKDFVLTSVDRLKETKEQWEENRARKELRQRMIDELPTIISLMKTGEMLTINEIQNRYNCDRELVEQVIIQLLEEKQISGTFNLFTGVLHISDDANHYELILDDDSSVDLVELDQTCFYCGEPIKANTKYCPSCKREVAICPVCKLSIDFDDKVGVCVQCGARGHFGHMREAVKVTGKCPICGEKMDWNEGITVFQRKPAK
ncbi:MAG: hypothetical protein GF308_04780 [Candidatus Heimdallarchaeota archaeon]|nr:hypothetical protein [Candidatus Heimdallarchaeota archaeon]